MNKDDRNSWSEGFCWPIGLFLLLLASTKTLSQSTTRQRPGEVLRNTAPQRAATTTPTTNSTRPSRVRHLQVRVRSDIVGDADGNGLLDAEDARFLRALIASNRRVVDRTERPLSDIAKPCGIINRADLRLLIASLRVQPTGYRLDSECHFR